MIFLLSLFTKQFNISLQKSFADDEFADNINLVIIDINFDLNI